MCLLTRDTYSSGWEWAKGPKDCSTTVKIFLKCCLLTASGVTPKQQEFILLEKLPIKN